MRSAPAVASLDVNRDDVRRAALVKVTGGGHQLVAQAARRERIQLQLDRREVVAGGQMAEGLPGCDGVAKANPDATVHEASGMQVALVDDQPSLGELIGDLDRFDAEVGRKRPALE
jgi:hypothetical protein